jgi:hypothetical protein
MATPSIDFERTFDHCGMVVVNWAALQAHVRTGQHVCPEHGLVDPYRSLVAACPECLQQTHVASRGKDGQVSWHTEQPSHCAGPDRHRLAPGKVLLGHIPCRCTLAGGHRTWTCLEPGCGDEQMWPPHDLSAVR